MNVISCLMYSQTNHLSPFCSKTYFLVRRQNLSPIAQNPACRRTCPFVGLVVRLHNPVGVDISDEDDEDDDDDDDDDDDEDDEEEEDWIPNTNDDLDDDSKPFRGSAHLQYATH